MMILRFMEQEIPCSYATKGNDWVEAHDEYGNTIFSANGVKDFSLFTLEGGEWGKPDNRTLDEIRADKLEELSSSCNAAITAGMDVETTKGTEHFSLQETDQINLTTALSAVQSGAAGYPYHADGQLCRLFTAAEIQAIAAASVRHKLYHTTLCNHLMAWARRAETREELSGITYAADGMPEDLAANMAAVLEASAGDNNA